MAREATVTRKTKETDITATVRVDGAGEARVSTGVAFLDHMLDTVARHGFFDLEVKAEGDLEVDYHHTVEDVGITLGQALTKALGDKKGIRRFGNFSAPLDEALASCVLDLSGRPCLVYNVRLAPTKIGTFHTELAEVFFKGFVDHTMATLHLNLLYGVNQHHIVEACFKSFARALDQATSVDPRAEGVVPSTKGAL
ncbi:MAG: imidazoleglycerol-phosphate dehydratase HisB [Candidatus Methylomirabilis sp.]|nr:imidazoleglycerol-phosphate dehydratase HisB [Deltaproteobacteria bacterium]